MTSLPLVKLCCIKQLQLQPHTCDIRNTICHLNLVESNMAPLLLTRLIENFSTVSQEKQIKITKGNSNQVILSTTYYVHKSRLDVLTQLLQCKEFIISPITPAQQC